MTRLFALCCFLLAVPAMACDLPVKTPLQALGLWEDAPLSQLEQSNDLQLCYHETSLEKCIGKKLDPDLRVYALYRNHKMTAADGALIVSYLHAGLQASLTFKKFPDHVAPVKVDIFDSDYGYGPYFHQTLLDRDGDSFLVSFGNLGRFWLRKPGAPVLAFKKGDIVTYQGKGHVILDINNETVTLRHEQKNDMWCDAGDPPPPEPFETIILPVKDLYDNNCTLLLTERYMRGC